MLFSDFSLCLREAVQTPGGLLRRSAGVGRLPRGPVPLHLDQHRALQESAVRRDAGVALKSNTNVFYTVMKNCDLVFVGGKGIFWRLHITLLNNFTSVERFIFIILCVFVISPNWPSSPLNKLLST